MSATPISLAVNGFFHFLQRPFAIVDHYALDIAIPQFLCNCTCKRLVVFNHPGNFLLSLHNSPSNG